MTQKNQSSKGVRQLFNIPSDTKSDRSCPICLEVFDNDECRETLTTCKHSFCEVCLTKTLKIRPFCPLCRQYQGKDQQNNQNSDSIRLDKNIPWNPQVVRAFYSREEVDEQGRLVRTVRLSNGERTGIHVSRGVKINISNNANITINGNRIQNPSDCNQQ